MIIIFIKWLNDSILPQDRIITGTTKEHLRVRVTKGYSIFFKVPGLGPHHQLLFSVIHRTLVERRSFPCVEVQLDIQRYNRKRYISLKNEEFLNISFWYFTLVSLKTKIAKPKYIKLNRSVYSPILFYFFTFFIFYKLLAYGFFRQIHIHFSAFTVIQCKETYDLLDVFRVHLKGQGHKAIYFHPF